MEIVCKSCNTSHYLSDDEIPLETKTGKCKQCSAPITVLGKNALGSIELSLTQSTPPEPEATKNCDFCGEKILAIAKKCRHCGSMLDGSHAANSQGAVEPDIKPPEEITPPRTDDFVDNTLSYKVDSAIKKAVNTVMTRLTTFYSSYRTKNNIHNQQKITETLKKFAWFELIKNLSLKSKIIYIAVFIVSLITAIEIGWSNLLAILFILLLVLWIVALFKPRVVLADTRRSASVRIAPVLFVLFIMMGVSQPPRNSGTASPEQRLLSKLMNPLNQDVAATKNPRYTPIQVKGLQYNYYNSYGYINTDGKVVIEPRFIKAFGFSDNGLALVESMEGTSTANRRHGYINTEGKFVIQPQFSKAESFTDDGLAKVDYANNMDTGKKGFINEKGELVIDLTDAYSFGNFSNGLAWVNDSSGKYSYINTEGKVIIKPYEFQEVGDFSKNGLAKVKFRENNKYGYINKQGDLVLNVGGYDFADNGLARIYGHISSSGFAERVILQGARPNNGGFINEKGEVVINEDNYGIYSEKFSNNGLARIRINKKYGYINSEGDIVIKAEFEDANDFSDNGLALVKVAEQDKYGGSVKKYGYINSEGDIVIKAEFERAENFSKNGLALVTIKDENTGNRKEGYINERGVYISDSELTNYSPQKIETHVTVAPQPVAEVATPEPVLNDSPASSEPQKIETPVTVETEVATTPEQVETPIATESQPVAEVATPTPATTTTPEVLELARYKAKEAIDEANKQINVVWQGASKETRKNLLPEQREWLKKRENDCDAKAKLEEANNLIIQETIKLNCMAEMTIKRTDELEAEIDVLVGD